MSNDKHQEPSQPDRANVPPQPNEEREKEWAGIKETQAKEFKRKMNDQGRENNIDPGHNYEHHGARIPDQGNRKR